MIILGRAKFQRSNFVWTSWKDNYINGNISVKQLNIKTMAEKKEQILDWCKDLSYSQGFYGRLYEKLRANETELNKLAEQNFDNIIDFVIFVES